MDVTQHFCSICLCQQKAQHNLTLVVDWLYIFISLNGLLLASFSILLF